MRVLIATDNNPEFAKILTSELPKTEAVFASSKEDVEREVGEAVVLIPERYAVDKSLLDIADKLRLIQCGTGYSHVDVEQATAKGVLVATAPGAVAPSVAEHVFSLIHEFYKKTSMFSNSMNQGSWNRSVAPIFELNGKTIGVVGFGNTGKRVAAIAIGYGMSVIVNRRKLAKDGFDVDLVSLKHLLQASDIVSLHLPLNRETKGPIGKSEFNMMKKTSFLVNTSRGEIVDETSLLRAIRNGDIGGAALDVFSNEPLPESSPLRGVPNLVLTPHVAYFAKEALERRMRAYASNIRRLEVGDPLLNLVSLDDD